MNKRAGCSPRGNIIVFRKQQTLTIRGSKKDAERELRAVLTRIESGAHVKPVKMTVGEYLERWLKEYVATNTAPTTADGYSDIVKAHLIPALGSLPLTALQPSHIQAYYGRMLESGRRDGKGGLSAQTVKHHHRVLYEALKHAVKHGLLIRNVGEAVDAPRPDSKEMSTLEPDDVRTLLNAARERLPIIPCSIRLFILDSGVASYLGLDGRMLTWTWRPSQLCKHFITYLGRATYLESLKQNVAGTLLICHHR